MAKHVFLFENEGLSLHQEPRAVGSAAHLHVDLES